MAGKLTLKIGTKLPEIWGTDSTCCCTWWSWCWDVECTNMDNMDHKAATSCFLPEILVANGSVWHLLVSTHDRTFTWSTAAGRYVISLHDWAVVTTRDSWRFSRLYRRERFRIGCPWTIPTGIWTIYELRVKPERCPCLFTLNEMLQVATAKYSTFFFDVLISMQCNLLVFLIAWPCGTWRSIWRNRWTLSWPQAADLATYPEKSTWVDEKSVSNHGFIAVVGIANSEVPWFEGTSLQYVCLWDEIWMKCVTSQKRRMRRLHLSQEYVLRVLQLFQSLVFLRIGMICKKLWILVETLFRLRKDWSMLIVDIISQVRSNEFLEDALFVSLVYV